MQRKMYEVKYNFYHLIVYSPIFLLFFLKFLCQLSHLYHEVRCFELFWGFKNGCPF